MGAESRCHRRTAKTLHTNLNRRFALNWRLIRNDEIDLPSAHIHEPGGIFTNDDAYAAGFCWIRSTRLACEHALVRSKANAVDRRDHSGRQRRGPLGLERNDAVSAELRDQLTGFYTLSQHPCVYR